MLKRIMLLAILIVTLCLAAGCMRQASLQNPTNIPVISATGKSLSEAKVKQAIVAGARAKGWIVRDMGPGIILASLSVRNHLAEVEIPYNGTSYSIIYKKSDNLKYDAEDQTIHNQYNNWVNYLRESINVQMSLLN